jgi:hypothetical protein
VISVVHISARVRAAQARRRSRVSPEEAARFLVPRKAVGDGAKRHDVVEFTAWQPRVGLIAVAAGGASDRKVFVEQVAVPHALTVASLRPSVATMSASFAGTALGLPLGTNGD